MLNSTHTLVSPTPTTLERYLLEFESSMSVSFVSEYSRKSSVPPLDHNGIVNTEEEEKVNILNTFFRDQTIRPDNNSFLPDIPL